jgi:predicted NBD/HSP70 family sugar kinase
VSTSASIHAPVEGTEGAEGTDTGAQADEQRLAVGLDIGGTKVLGVLLDPDGSVLGSVRLPTVRGADGVVSSACQVVRQLAAAAAVPLSDIGSVGVGVPGLVDPLTGSVTHAVNLGIRGGGFRLADRMSGALGGVPVHVDNDLNVAALGASFALGGETHDLVYLAVGTGLAAGIVIDGELRRGASGAAGEVGHIPIRSDGPDCACGQRGCGELYASGSGLARQWESRTDAPLPLEIFEAAAAGDARAIAIRDDFAAALADVVRLVVLSFDPQRIVVGGGISGLGDELLRVLSAALARQAAASAFLASLRIPDRITLAPADVPIAAVGAALAAL